MADAARILVVEDESGLRLMLRDRLLASGYRVTLAENAEAAATHVAQRDFDVIVLDIMLPGIDGFEFCSALRRRGIGTPVLMLTARAEVEDKVNGLHRGADDYLTKPFAMAEFLARIEALLRRLPESKAIPTIYDFGPLHVDIVARMATLDGQVMDLSAREFDLLRYFALNAGKSLSRDQILADVWGTDASPTTRTVDVHVAWLRKKLGAHPGAEHLLQTQRGVGYRFTEA